jgi:hypothetical protein
MIGVSPSTLSRRESVQAAAEAEGDRYKRLHPYLVLQEAAHFKREPLSQVAARLVEYAEDHANEAIGAVEQEVEAFFETRGEARRMSAAEFLDIARHNFPAPLVRQIERVVSESGRGPNRVAASESISASRPA